MMFHLLIIGLLLPLKVLLVLFPLRTCGVLHEQARNCEPPSLPAMTRQNMFFISLAKTLSLSEQSRRMGKKLAGRISLAQE